MKRVFSILMLMIVLVSCKPDYKNKIWRNGDSYFQITDSLVYFNHSSSTDYFYKIKKDSIFLNNGLCNLKSLSYKIELSNNNLTLTGFQNHYNKWLYERDSLNYKKDTFKFKLAKIQSDTLSKKWSIQKIIYNSFDCKVEGSWYDSLTNQILVFEDVFCFKANTNEASILSFTKSDYKCYKKNSFILRSQFCQADYFELESRNNNLMKWNSERLNRDSYIYRIDNIDIDTSDYIDSNYQGRLYFKDSLNLNPIQIQ